MLFCQPKALFLKTYGFVHDFLFRIDFYKYSRVSVIYYKFVVNPFLIFSIIC